MRDALISIAEECAGWRQLGNDVSASLGADGVIVMARCIGNDRLFSKAHVFSWDQLDTIQFLAISAAIKSVIEDAKSAARAA